MTFTVDTKRPVQSERDAAARTQRTQESEPLVCPYMQDVFLHWKKKKTVRPNSPHFFSVFSCASVAQLVSIMETENQPDFNNTSSPPQPVLHSVPASGKNRSPALFSPGRKRAARATGEISRATRKLKNSAAERDLVSSWRQRPLLKEVTGEQNDVRTRQKNRGNPGERGVKEG